MINVLLLTNEFEDYFSKSMPGSATEGRGVAAELPNPTGRLGRRHPHIQCYLLCCWWSLIGSYRVRAQKKRRRDTRCGWTRGEREQIMVTKVPSEQAKSKVAFNTCVKISKYLNKESS